MSDELAVLFANDAFYTAFLGRDYAAMESLWSREVKVTCIHPGWAPLYGRDAVMQSWRSILTGPNAPDILCRQARAQVLANTAYVLCYEILEAGPLVATNVFVRESGVWKMVHHQAGATATAPPKDEPDAGPLQ